MKIKSMLKGVGLGAAAGTAIYIMSKATSRQKHDIRKNTNKAIKAAGCILDDITSIIM